MEGARNAEIGAALGENHQAAVINATNNEGDVGDITLDDEDRELEQDMDPRTKHLVDYCKRGTTRCRRCKKNIPKGELRIGRPAKFKAKYIYHYFHVKRQDQTQIRSPAWTI